MPSRHNTPLLSPWPLCALFLLCTQLACSERVDCTLTGTCEQPEGVDAGQMQPAETPEAMTTSTLRPEDTEPTSANGKTDAAPGSVIVVERPVLPGADAAAHDGGSVDNGVVQGQRLDGGVASSDAGARQPDPNMSCQGVDCLCLAAMCEASGQVCSNTGTCVECAANGDCLNAVCDNHTCVECAADGDCNNGVCQNNQCVECAVSDDCTIGVCDNNQCVGCVANGDCKVGVCDKNQCVGCAVNDDCAGGVCSASVCVECTVSDDCANGVCQDNTCVECAVNGDCADGVCQNNTCVQCAADGDCADGVCSKNTCVECAADGDCAGGVCSKNTCVQCTNDEHCGDNVCDSNRCVQCTNDKHCGNGVCDSNACFECTSDKHCDNGVCDNNACFECTSDKHCGDGVCDNNACFECTSDKHCGDGVCLKNVCSACDETDNSGCGGAKPVCARGATQAENQCVTCTTQIDCNGASLPTLSATLPDLVKVRANAPVVMKLQVATTNLDEGTIEVAALNLPAGLELSADPVAVTKRGAKPELRLELQASASAAHGGPFPLDVEFRSSLDPKIKTTASAQYYVAGEPGALDTSFGGNGKVLLSPINSGQSFVPRAAVYGSGRIVVSSTASSGDDSAWLAALNPDGSTDTSYAGNGQVRFPAELDVEPPVRFGEGTALFITPPNGNSFVRVLKSNGRPDSGFGIGGEVTLPGSGAYHFVSAGSVLLWVNRGRATRIEANGQVGEAVSMDGGLRFAVDLQGRQWFDTYEGEESSRYILNRWTAGGKSDSSFGSGGKVTFKGPGGWDELTISKIAPALNGGALVSFDTDEDNGPHTVTVRRLNDAGVLDNKFASTVRLDDGHCSDILVRPSGAFVFSWMKYGVGITYGLSFYTKDGKVDTRINPDDANDAISGYTRTYLSYDAAADRLLITSSKGIKTVVARIWL